MRMLAGKPGTKVTLAVLRGNAAEPHQVELVREELPVAAVRGHAWCPAAVGYLRIRGVRQSDAGSDAQRGRHADQGRRDATRHRSARHGVWRRRERVSPPPACSCRRARWAIARSAARRKSRSPPRPATAASTLPVALLTDNGTSGPAELFAAALTGNKRASLVGERTLGRAARQRLVRLPDGSGLLLTHLFYLTPTKR